MSAPALVAPRSLRRRRRSDRAAYGFVAPNLALLALFVLVPLLGTLVLSPERTNGFFGGAFIELGN